MKIRFSAFQRQFPKPYRLVYISMVILTMILLLVNILILTLPASAPLHIRIFQYFPGVVILSAIGLLLAGVIFLRAERLTSAVQQSEQHLGIFLDTMPWGVALLAKDGSLELANEKARHLLADDSLACLTRSDPEVSHLLLAETDLPYPLEKLPISLALLGTPGSVADAEVRLSAERTPLEISATPIFDHLGDVEHVIVILMDITDRKIAEQKLRIQRDLFDKFVSIARTTSSSPTIELVISRALDVPLTITQADRASMFLVEHGEMSMYSLRVREDAMRSEFLGNTSTVLDRGLSGWVYHNLEPALVPDVSIDPRWIQLSSQEYAIRSAMVVPVLLNGTPLGVLGLFHGQENWFTPEQLSFLQVTAEQLAMAMRNVKLSEEEHRQSEELARAKEIAEAAHRSKSLFLAKMNHELRAHLTVILGYSDMLQEYSRQANQETIRSPLTRIQSAANKLLQLINEILDFSEIEAGRLYLLPTNFEVNRLLQGVMEKTTPLAAKGQNTLVAEIPGNLGTMRSDITRVTQILDNLLDNACKYTRQGTITLKASRNRDASEEWISFEISDTGTGISPEQVQRLFRSFNPAETTIHRSDGTGLGLAVSRQLARMLGGDIKVVSQPGKGSKFTVRLPVILTNI